MDFDPHKKANTCEYISEQARISSVSLKSAVPRRKHLAEAKCTEEACLRRGHSPKVNPKGAQACARRGGSMDFLMESGFMHWMSERMSFTNWVKADFHETSRITLKFSASPREISARRGEFALRQLLFLGSTSSPRSICPSLPLHLSSFSLSCPSFRQPFPFLHLPCPFHVRQERPKKGRQESHLYFSA